jgi:hypothetical protein
MDNYTRYLFDNSGKLIEKDIEAIKDIYINS